MGSLRTTSNICLVVMVITWAIISVMHGVMVAVSDNFMIVAGFLYSGGHAGDALLNKFQTRRR